MIVEFGIIHSDKAIIGDINADIKAFSVNHMAWLAEKPHYVNLNQRIEVSDVVCQYDGRHRFLIQIDGERNALKDDGIIPAMVAMVERANSAGCVVEIIQQTTRPQWEWHETAFDQPPETFLGEIKSLLARGVPVSRMGANHQRCVEHMVARLPLLGQWIAEAERLQRELIDHVWAECPDV